MTIPTIPFEEGEARLDWLELARALAAGHDRPKAQIKDTFLYRDPDTVLTRSAWIDGLGMAVKTATVFPGNPGRGRPMIHGAVNLFDDNDGTLSALVDFNLVTKWKTAGDSLLAALKLANPGSKRILILGAGTVGQSLCQAFRAGFPQAQITLWNRTRGKAEALAKTLGDVDVADILADAVSNADIVVSATMTRQSILRGDWLRPGQHVNLVGAYRPDMREADDGVLQKSNIFVDSFDTTIGHIGEIDIPLQSGAIRREDLIADYYQLSKFRHDPTTVTLFKNGGGAHLDLMTSRYILDQWKAKS